MATTARPRSLTRSAGLALAAAALLAACSSGSDSSSSSTTQRSSTTSAVDSSSPSSTSSSSTASSTSTTEPASDVLPPGESYVYLKSAGTGDTVTNGGAKLRTVTFDLIQFLTGQAAIDAAVAHGDAELDPDGKPFVPNDYYIVNDNPKLRTMSVTPDASITMLGCDGGCADQPQPATLDEAVTVPGPFKVTVQGKGADGRIVKIEQIFIP